MICQLHRIERGEPGGENLRSRSWCAYIYENVRVGQTASAEDAKLRLLKARSPSRLGGLGERRKLPQRGLGRTKRGVRAEKEGDGGGGGGGGGTPSPPPSGVWGGATETEAILSISCQ